MGRTETPKYTVIQSQGNIEIRHYKPMIVATVQVGGGRKDARGAGFRLLADYIFGNNIARQGIAMTAPVQQQSAKIAMTAPVQQESVGELWQVSFVMPSQYSMASLPKPGNERVTLKEVPAKRFIVLTFSGTHSDGNVKAHEEKLMAYITANALSTKGPVKYAFYNPPWTLPFMRRNEVMVEVA